MTNVHSPPCKFTPFFFLSSLLPSAGFFRMREEGKSKVEKETGEGIGRRENGRKVVKGGSKGAE